MFTFNGIRARDMGVSVRQLTRELKPEKRVTKTTIGGRDGSYDYSDGTFANTVLTFECTFMGIDVDKFKNNVALWLVNGGVLTLDTDPTKHYNANLYSSVPLNQMIYVHEFTLVFDCEPFAVSDTRQITVTLGGSGAEIGVHSDGTQHTPCVIIIRNIGTADITGITITRKANIL